MKKQFLGLMLSAAVCALSPAYAMEQDDSITQGISQNKIVIHIPEKFPGHNTRLIQGSIKVPDYFNPADYQQEKLRNEGVCKFSSMLAGIMDTEYGRAKVQAIIESQDDTHVNIRFYFPPTDDLKKYDADSTLSGLLREMKSLQQTVDNPENEEQKKEYQGYIDEVKSELEAASLFWDKVLDLSHTTVRVPKKFISREDKGSFPHNNPEWLNLMQQAYMKVTKNPNLARYSHGHYSLEEEITESDCFGGVPFCTLSQGSYDNTPSGLTNLIKAPSCQTLEFFPLINIPIKSVKLLISKDGLDLPAIKDFKAEIQSGNSIMYTPLTYKNVTDFAHSHGLSKDLLMASNVIQFSSTGHAVALLFGKGKVHYYDNVHYPEQVKVYGVAGPVYEEAMCFKAQDLNAMDEEEFFARLFQEIPYRLKQVTDVRGQEAVLTTKISFFEKPLVSQK